MRAGAIVRPRLLELLDVDPAPVTVLQAPSGYGKTTLVRQWAAGPRPPDERLVWVALSAEVESDRAFWTAVITAGRRLGHLSPERAGVVADDVDALDDPVPVLRNLVVDGRPVTLVVDAYEHVRHAAAQVDSDILRLAAELPHLRIVVTTRAGTTLADPVHRVRDAVRLIGEEDLGFTSEETALLFAEHLPGDLAEVAEQVHHDTHGYPLAIRAASLALRGRSCPPARDSAEWRAIVAQDLSSQMHDPVLSAFVRDTAAAPYFDLELAQALTGLEDAGPIVDQLEWNGFGRWVPYLADRPVFQYVDSLREAVRDDLRTNDSDRYRRSAGTAATWLHDNDEHEQALELAVDAGRYELASRIFRSVLLSSPESYTTDHLDRQLARIPRALLMRQPVLAFARGLALLSNPATRGAAGEYFLRTADQTSDDWRHLDRGSSFFQRVAKSASLRFVGRYVEAATAGRAALDFYDDIDIGDDDRLLELRAMGLRQVGYSLFQAGELEDAHAVVTRAIATATRPWARNYTLVYGVGLSAIDGRCREAAHTARLIDPRAWPRDHAHTYVNALGRIGNAMLRLDDFDFAGAIAEYDGCESFIHTAEFWPFLTWTLLQARLGLEESGPEVQRVADALQAWPPPPGAGDSFGTSVLHGLLAITWLSEGRTREAAELLRRPSRWPGQVAPAQVLSRLTGGDAAGALHVVPRLESLPGHSIRSRAGLATLGAAAALRAGHPDAAGALLDRAASLHAEHGVRAHLLHVPGKDLEALRDLARHSGRAAAASYLDVDVVGTIDPGVEVSPLTAQELAVLRASVDHPRRSDLAAALHLSPETVKSHMRSIYRKWGVNTREAALERGIRLGLLGDDRPG
ncbi:LuxR C-terminal-related transcriptional regulator [Nocardioides carbamazepini]|uniref:LuxR C-terminal-related transcriptional regulator n=1 Tax=Nocardioides carbamazepini TaxID=2854259 RepID=UPI00214A1F99|nr:LuxR C-terminal-related transcriptional regulator [Nocardioides carbamazepini]MCR1784884.1 LuxR C-terminal-related transcriptional regulator [Nocardioides carbamazepini]